MGFEELWEKFRVEQLAFMRTRIAVLNSRIASYKKDIARWSEAAGTEETERKRALKTFKELLEEAERNREYYRARIAKYEGFDIVRADVH